MLEPPELCPPELCPSELCPSVPDVSFLLDLVSRSSCIVPQCHHSCPLLILQPHSGFPVCWDESQTVVPLSIQPHSWFPVCWDCSVLKSRSPCKQVTASWLVLGPSNVLCLPQTPSIFPAIQSFVQVLCQVVPALCIDDRNHFFWVMLVSALLLFPCVTKAHGLLVEVSV